MFMKNRVLIFNMDIYMKSNSFFLMIVIFLSGCTVDMSSSMPDYQGNDTSFIRVDNSFQPTLFRLEKMLPAAECMKSEGVYGLTSKVAVMGIKTSYSKRVTGIASPSTQFSNRGYLEYTIQSGKVYKIWWHFDEKSMYGIDLGRTFERSFTAEDGHSYEIQTKGNHVVIYDISERKEADYVSVKECQYKKTMLGKKEYL